MADNAQNSESMRDAVETLKQIASNNTTPRAIKKSLLELIADLNVQDLSMSVRAANAISMLDDVTQDPNMPSYVRTQLWQAVSKLESIRE